ncbi:uncharacterized protein YbjT (DUF2867 family) [Maritalea mobilis]|uniref:Uncharacterized protein YbjT (DUF2867 family) n=1 Tax=Maritalea mobilis TaxID=483324 RepID=A0A4R6VSH4_9HYPH|nr:SDR family oxidoreductase [Maritalea mobilis]TDQ66989.1 uncharacterized protein YbjT (DUF2867 family) [Maritalea mobilis]
MNVLVLGGYGLIGSAVTRDLLAGGHSVIGVGRNPTVGKNKFPSAIWQAANLQDMVDEASWLPFLDGIDAVVNCSGALQDQANVSLEALQVKAIMSLVDAMISTNVAKFVQISALGATPNATTRFLRTKAKADAYVANSDLDWTIIRPGLVLSTDTFGGSTILRIAAAMPVFDVRIFPESKVQTVHVDDVAEVVAQSLVDDSLTRKCFDLVEENSISLSDLTLNLRQKIGNRPPKISFTLPRFIKNSIGVVGDLISNLGWQTGIRSTAFKVLENGVTGDASVFTGITGKRLKDAPQNVAEMGLGAQDLLFGRIQLVAVPAIFLFGAFWVFSGAIGVWNLDAAVAKISHRFNEDVSYVFVICGSLLDLLIGLAIWFRKTHVFALLASLVLSSGYLAAGTFFTPELWMDPLGPLVKIIPVMLTAMFLLAARPAR